LQEREERISSLGKRLSADVDDAVNRPGAVPIVLNDEVVALGPEGRPDFAMLERLLRPGKASASQVTYIVFDCLYANGHNLRTARFAIGSPCSLPSSQLSTRRPAHESHPKLPPTQATAGQMGQASVQAMLDETPA
jgi:hypothetical protein